METDVGLVVVWVMVVIGWMVAIVWLLAEILRVAKRIDRSVTRLAFGAEAPAELARRDAAEAARKDPAAGIRAQQRAIEEAERGAAARER